MASSVYSDAAESFRLQRAERMRAASSASSLKAWPQQPFGCLSDKRGKPLLRVQWSDRNLPWLWLGGQNFVTKPR